MIRSYHDHAANERTFLAWVRTGLSFIALGVVVKKGSLLSLVMVGASSLALSTSAQDHLSDLGGAVVIATGFVAMAGAVVRFVHTALRIEDQDMHSAGIVLLASPLLRRRRAAVGRASTNAEWAARGLRRLLRRRATVDTDAQTLGEEDEPCSSFSSMT